MLRRLVVLVVLGLGLPARAAVTARYLRVDNPTGFVMEWRQLEVYSGGRNLVRNHPQWITGTVPPRDEGHQTRDSIILTGEREAREVSNGDVDTSHRASEWRAFVNPADNAHDWNPWLEVDLGSEQPIDKVVLYGSRYPSTVYLDKGHRVAALLGEDRRVRWAAKWQYYDQAAFPQGRFSFEPVVQAPADNPVAGTLVPPRAPDWVALGWLLNADASIPPPDLERRRQVFAGRGEPAQVQALAEQFVPLLDERLPALAPVFAHYRAGRYAAALEAWKRYWFAKLAQANLHIALHQDFVSYSANGDDLMAGLMVTINPNEARALRYTPGEVHWIDLPTDQRKLGEALSDCERKAQVGRVCWPLLAAYRRRPDPRYLQRWAELMDDWSLNFFRDAEQTPYEAENLFTFNPAHAWGTLMEDLSDLAVARPEAIDRLPATTLARMQLLCLEKYSTAWWRQTRETVFNHVTGGLYAWSLIMPYLGEFHPGQRAAKELREGFERFMTLATERDGSLTEIGDDGHQEIPTILGYSFDLFDHTRPEWYTPGWRNRAVEWYENVHQYMFRHLAPGGFEHRFAVGYRPQRWQSTWKQYWVDRPRFHPLDRDAEYFAIPEVRRLLDAWGHVSGGFYDPGDPLLKSRLESQRKSQQLVLGVLGADRPGAPHLNSDWMPYTGAYYFRGHWRDDAPFLAMMACGSHGGSQAPQWPYSMWYQYDHDYPLFAAQPVQVDGLPPQQLHGRMNCYEPGTKTMCLTRADEQPAPLRWLSDERFDFGEADFRGGYQRYPNFKGDWGPGLQILDAGRAVTDMHAARQIVQLRGTRLFLLTDLVQSPDGAAHDLTLPYKVSLSTRKQGATHPFGPEQLQLEAARGLLRSDNPDGPSASLWQVSDQPLRYDRRGTAAPDFRYYAPRLTDNIGIANQEVSVGTRAARWCLVSLLASRAKGEAERVAVCEPLPGDGVTGLHARLTSGEEVWYQTAGFGAAGFGAAGLAAGPGAALGRALLVVKAADGLSGLLLGGTQLSLEGSAVALPGPDAEFVAAGGRVQTTEILRPLDPVRFTPGVNTFVDHLEVELVSATPRVQIRYTTDGTQPTLNSTLYTGPLTLRQTTELCARAWRLGANGQPLPHDTFEVNGTHFTAPSYGWFKRADWQPPVAVEPAKLKPGLAYDLLAAPWWRLYASAHWLPAIASGTVARELDLTPANRSPEPYGLRYRGYLRVPADGVYTFWAPPELIEMDCATSYDLRVYVDGQEWSLTQWWHGRGTWSVPLRAGLHRFQVDFADARTTPWRKSGIWRYYPRPWAVYQGDPSPLRLSGPGFARDRIPAAWLWREG